MITQDEIAKLAREYVADLYNGDTDFINEAENVISWLLRTHCIVSKEKVNEEYQTALSQIEDGRVYDVPRMESYGMGKQKVLESLFDAETFKNSEV